MFFNASRWVPHMVVVTANFCTFATQSMALLNHDYVKLPIEYGFTITKPAKNSCGLASVVHLLQRCRNLLYYQ